MAKFYTDNKGAYCKLRVGGRRRTFRLSGFPKREAAKVFEQLDSLEAAVNAGTTVAPQTAVWLTEIDSDLRNRIAAIGLCEDRKQWTVGELRDAWLEFKSKQVAETTLETLRGSIASFVLLAGGEDINLREITKSQTLEFRQIMEAAGLKPSTINKRLLHAKGCLAFAVENHAIEQNPMEWFHPKQQPGAEKHYVPTDEIERLAKLAPSDEWGRLLVFSRYCGLRVPSEIRQLKWSDIDEDEKWITIHAPKTKQHPKGGIRKCPLFKELRPHLASVGDKAGYVFPMLHNQTNHICNLQYWLRKLGIKLWSKPFNSMRSSRITDLIRDGRQVKAIANWMGNSPQTIWQHYAQELEDDRDGLV